MLRIFTNADQIRFWQLVSIYEESNTIKAASLYPNMDRNAAIHLVEQELYRYYTDVFFEKKDAYCAMWEEDGECVCSARVEPFMDGVLISGLETVVAFRNRGFSKKLLLAVLGQEERIIYSHVEKNNHISIRVHERVGFEIIEDRCVFLDGSSSGEYFTLRRLRQEKDVDK